MLGYCKTCDKLVALRRKDNRTIYGTVDYFPVPHGNCDGHKRAL